MDTLTILTALLVLDCKKDSFWLEIEIMVWGHSYKGFLVCKVLNVILIFVNIITLSRTLPDLQYFVEAKHSTWLSAP